MQCLSTLCERGLLGPEFDPDQHAGTAFPALQQALSRLQALTLGEADLDDFQSASLPSICSSTAPKMQGIIGAIRKRKQYGDLSSKLPANTDQEQERKAFFISGALSAASRWIHGHSCKLADAQYVPVAVLRLGLSTLVPAAAGGDLLCTKDKSNNIVRADGLHALTCKGRQNKDRNPLHAAIVRQVIVPWLVKHLRKAGCEVKVEPNPSQWWLPTPKALADGTQSRGDIIVLRPGDHQPMALYDVRTCSPLSQFALKKKSYSEQGVAAQVAFDDKKKHYREITTAPDALVMPLIFELGGHVHPQSLQSLKDVITIAFTRKDDSGLFEIDDIGRGRAISELLEHLQSTIQRYNGYAQNNLAFYSRTMQPAPSQQAAAINIAAGPAQGAAANGGGVNSGRARESDSEGEA